MNINNARYFKIKSKKWWNLGNTGVCSAQLAEMGRQSNCHLMKKVKCLLSASIQGSVLVCGNGEEVRKVQDHVIYSACEVYVLNMTVYEVMDAGLVRLKLKGNAENFDTKSFCPRWISEIKKKKVKVLPGKRIKRRLGIAQAISANRRCWS